MSQDTGSPIIPNAQASLSGSRLPLTQAFEVLRSLHSGTAAPTATVAFMLWADTTTGLLKQRDAADAAWIVLWKLDQGPAQSTPIAKVFADSPVAIDQPGVYYCDATLGAISIVLPDHAVANGWLVTVVKTDGSGNAVTLSRAGSDTIEGATSIALAAQYNKTAVLGSGTATFYKAPGI